MNHKLIEAILGYDWDPISVKDDPSAKDEYENYVPIFASLLTQSASLDRIADALLRIERKQMGLAGDEQRARVVAQKLLQLKHD